VLTYGVGSIVESANGPRIILEFEKWGRVFGPGKNPSVEKFEISDLSASQLLKGRIFRIPTNLELEIPQNKIAFKTGTFPRWALCERHDILFQIGRHDITRCTGCINEGYRESARKQAIRFVRVCTSGHLDDIDWHGIVHFSKDVTCNSTIFEWRSEGSSLRNVWIRCTECEKVASLEDVYARTLTCTGRFQENPETSPIECRKKPQITLRGSSSLRVPEIISTIALPRRSSPLHRILESRSMRMWILGETDWTKDKLLNKLIFLSEQDASLVDPIIIDVIKQADEEYILGIIDEIRQRSKKQTVTMDEIKIEEFRELQNAANNGHPPDPTERNKEFQVNKNDVNTKEKWRSINLRITPIENLRVVIVQKGYRRLGTDQSVNKVVETFYDDGTSNWYPGIEQYGEGIFIDATSSLNISNNDWETAMTNRKDQLCHPLFVWWHTLSHRLITALSIDSGYSSASIRERVYIDIDKNRGTAKGGLLLYATQPGGDGSMGGLIALVPEFERVLESAERNLDACSNDPLCQEEKISAGRHNGSACYACLLLSETSCEHRNMYLDRNILRETK
jgi:hypothetical protein